MTWHNVMYGSRATTSRRKVAESRNVKCVRESPVDIVLDNLDEDMSMKTD